MLAAALLVALTVTLAHAASARMPAAPHVTIHEDTPCPYYKNGGSCSYADSDDIYLEPGADRFDRQHEIGHQFDRQVLTGPDRAWFTAQFGYPAGTPWNGDVVFYTSAALSKTLPAERFADAYAACALDLRPQGKRRGGMRVANWVTAYGYHPTVRQHRRVCNGIAVIGLVRLDLSRRA